MNAEYIITVAFGFLLAATYLSYSFYRDRKALFQNDYSSESLSKICSRLIKEQQQAPKPQSTFRTFSLRRLPKQAQVQKLNYMTGKGDNLKVLETFACRE